MKTSDQVDWYGKTAIVRGDLDVGIKEDNVSKRLEVLIETIRNILEKDAKQVVIMGHRGRPSGNRVEDLSNKEFVDYFSSQFGQSVEFVDDVDSHLDSDSKIRLLENLRFWEGEEANDEDFARKLSAFGDIYVNEAFAASHRNHASIVGLPKLLPHAAGKWLAKEVENLSHVTKDPERPLLFILSGAKKDKVDMIENIKNLADKILIGGRLPTYLPEDYGDEKVLVAQLNPDKEDITLGSIEKFEGEISTAKTIVLAGVTGKYEDEGQRLGTERVFRAVSDSKAFKVVGGGDSLVIVSMLGLADKFDWVSVGGGAMLEFLSKGTLPGIQSLEV